MIQVDASTIGLELVKRNGDTYVTFVDDTESMRQVLQGHRIHHMFCRWPVGRRSYAMTYINGERVYLHHLVLQKKPGFVVDHIDNDPLNNRSANLRHVSRRVNTYNTGMRSSNTSGMTGIRRRDDYGPHSYHHWEVRWHSEDRKLKVKCFSDSKHGGYEGAKQAAIKFHEEIMKTIPDYVEAHSGMLPVQVVADQ